MAAKKEKKYVCIREKEIGKHEIDITELKVRAEVKEEKIKQITLSLHDLDIKLDKNMNDMDAKLDKITNAIEDLKLQSAKDDFNIDNRVKALESKLETLKWVVGVALTILTILVSIIGLILTHII